MKFKDLHTQESLLLLCNVWDVASAKAAKKAGFKAIGTSSAAVADVLGYRDGEEMSFEELLYVVKRIRSCVDVPLSVDMEAGYSRDREQIVKNILALAETGVVGINFEDSIPGAKRSLMDAEDFASNLAFISQKLREEQAEVYINVRTDAFILRQKDALEQTLLRAKIYEQAGANGLFVPYLKEKSGIQAVIESTQLPLNVLAMPGLPDLETLAALGVKRVSMGNFAYDKTQAGLLDLLTEVRSNHSLSSLFS